MSTISPKLPGETDEAYQRRLNQIGQKSADDLLARQTDATKAVEQKAKYDNEQKQLHDQAKPPKSRPVGNG
jgi:hypothetical protein